MVFRASVAFMQARMGYVTKWFCAQKLQLFSKLQNPEFKIRRDWEFLHLIGSSCKLEKKRFAFYALSATTMLTKESVISLESLFRQKYYRAIMNLKRNSWLEKAVFCI